MRVMVMVKGNDETEAGMPPDTEMLNAMGRYNEELVKAGVMLDGEGLHPSSKGVRIQFSRRQAHRGRRPVRRDEGADRRLLDLAGPRSWTRRSSGRSAARTRPARRASLEIRPVFELEDFGDNVTPEVRERDERLRSQLEERS